MVLCVCLGAWLQNVHELHKCKNFRDSKFFSSWGKCEKVECSKSLDLLFCYSKFNVPLYITVWSYISLPCPNLRPDSRQWQQSPEELAPPPELQLQQRETKAGNVKEWHPRNAPGINGMKGTLTVSPPPMAPIHRKRIERSTQTLKTRWHVQIHFEQLVKKTCFLQYK